MSKKTYTVCDVCGRHVGGGLQDIRDNGMLYIRARRQWRLYDEWLHDSGKSRETLAICAECQEKIRLLMKVPLVRIAELAGGGLEGDTE